MQYRGLTQSAREYLRDNKQVRVAHLVTLELPDTSGGSINGYFTDYGDDLVYQGRIYTSNTILKITDVKENTNIKVDTINIEVAGEFQVELDRALRDPTDVSYINKDITILRAFLNEAGEIIDFDTAGGPMKYFTGQIKDINISEGVSSGNSTVKWVAANHFSYFEKVSGRLTSDASHRGLVSVQTSPGVYEDIPNSSVARKASYTSDLGFFHADTAVDTQANYKATETRFKMQRRGGFAGAFGMERMVEYEVEVERTLDIRFNLSAKYLPIIYGVRRVGANPVFTGVDKANPDQLYAVYTVCEGEIDGFLNLYIDDKTIICADSEDGDETLCIGNQRVGGTIEQFAEGGLGGTGAPSVHGRKYVISDETGTINVTVYHGKSNQTADPDLVAVAADEGFILQGDTSAEDYWGSNHRLLDTAYIVVNAEINEERQELPDIEVVVQGRQINTWPANNFTEAAAKKDYTLNMSWMLLDYLTSTSGGQLDLSDLDIESFYKLSEKLEVEDTSYEVSWVPFWKYVGFRVPSNTYVDAHGVTRYTRAKYQCNALINTDEIVFKNISNMLAQIRASLNYIGGKYVISFENDDPVVLDADGNPTTIDVLQECKGSIGSTNNTTKTSWNTVDANFTDPALGFTSNNVVFFNEDFKTADNDVEKKGRLAFNYITNYYTGRSLVAQELKRSRYARQFTITTYYKYSYLKVNDNIFLKYDRFFTTPKKLRVASVTLQADGLVRLTLMDYDPSQFVTDNQSDNSDNQVTPILGVRAPTNIEILRDWTIEEETPANTSFLIKFDRSASAPVDRYEMRWSIFRTSNGNDKQISGIFDIDPNKVDPIDGKVYAFAVDIEPRADNWTFKVEIRTVLSSGAYSSWAEKTLDSTDNLYPLELPPIENLKVINLEPGTINRFYGSSLDVEWDNQTSPTNKYEIVIYNATNELETYSSWIQDLVPGEEKASFSYILDYNLADHQAVTGLLGVYRNLGLKVRARANIDLSSGKQGGLYPEEGAGPWAYVEVNNA